PDVEIETILAPCGFAGRCLWGGGRRRAAVAAARATTRAATAAKRGTGRAWRAKRVGIADALPFGRRLRRSPPVFPERRSGERNALERAHRCLGAPGRAG